jgi:hypothetical protein
LNWPIGHQPAALRELAPSGDHRYLLILRKLCQTRPLQHNEIVGNSDCSRKVAPYATRKS